TQVFCGIEAKSRGPAHRACLFVAPLRAKGLRRVFNDLNLMLMGHAVELVHVGALPVEMDGHDGSYSVRTRPPQRTLRSSRIEIQCGRIDVGQHRSGAATYDGAHRSKETERAGDD